MKVSIALLELFKKERRWRRFFKSCCETSTYRLTAQAWQFRDEFRDRSHHFPAEEVEDALLNLARDLLPESAAAKWDADRAHELCKRALTSLAEYHTRLSAKEKAALDLSAQDTWEERITAAALVNDYAAFRAALKGWEQAGLEALERARVKVGAT